jgi:glutamate-ammonia-ligase adenylyltransferase
MAIRGAVERRPRCNEAMSKPTSLLARSKKAPPPFALEQVQRAKAALAVAAESDAALQALLADERVSALLASIFGNSAFLTRAILREPAMLTGLFAEKPETSLERVVVRVEEAAQTADLNALMSVMRQARAEAAVLVALADVGGAWALADVTSALTKFADACIAGTVRALLRAEARAGYFAPREPEAPERDSGYFVLAMGKYGAHELNYSSDVDLVVFFDDAGFSERVKEEPQKTAVRLTRELVRVLSERTADGYVFRVDLRLRPDAGATQVAIGTRAAEIYYESMGQNWERAAMIKARVCAGDTAAGEALLATLKPFIWRKHLDFAAIDDIHSIKRQIHAERGHGTIAVAGHNIKLGRGGIREIEFFVQTQQLILGGRDPSLRGGTTLGVLDALAARGHITAEAASELKAAYVFLRTIEHRLQMVEDEQTHALPREEEGLDHIARFSGYEETAQFEAALRAHLGTVQRHYAALFESAPALSEEVGSLVFTGVEEDPETLATLGALGFKRAAEVSATIRSWHHGRLPATRSARARELLTELVPFILRALARTGDADGAFFRFSRFLEGLPAGVQLFSLLYANPRLLDLLALCLGTAPRLATYLARNAAVLDALLDPDFAARLPGEAELHRGFEAVVASARDFEDMLDGARRYAREQRFRVGFQILNASADADAAGLAYARLAETALENLLPRVEEAFARRHGRIEGAKLALIAMGKLGGREMTASSDLDLILVYDAPDRESAGAQPLPASTYFARLTQRFINALTAPTQSGKLYDVDMRLRPSGRAGPVATHIESFQRYHAEAAWTWEHMALSRARLIAGEPALRARVTEIIRAVLTRPRERRSLARDVADMRLRIEKESPVKDVWEIKYAKGGLVDLEFIVQFLMLAHAADEPGVLQTNTREALRALAEHSVLSAEHHRVLEEGRLLLHTLMQVLRVAVEGPFVPAEAGAGLAALLCRAADAPSLSRLESRLIETQSDIAALFEDIVVAAAR